MQSFGVAVGRMACQLLVLCLIVWALVKYDSVWLTLLWLVVLSVASALLVVKRVKMRISAFVPPVAAGLFAGALIVGSYLLGAVLPVTDWLGARWAVPVIALLVGHSMTTTIRGLSAYHSALKLTSSSMSSCAVTVMTICTPFCLSYAGLCRQSLPLRWPI